MFGFGKKKKEDAGEFVFDEAGENFAADETAYDSSPSLMKGGGGGGSRFSPKLIGVIALLLVIGGGAAYYFLYMTPAPAKKPAKPAPRKVVAVAPKPAKPATQPATAATAPATATPVAATPPQPAATTAAPVAAQKPAGTPATATVPATQPAAPQSPPAQPVAVTPAPAVKPTPAKAQPAVPPQPVAVTQPPAEAKVSPKVAVTPEKKQAAKPAKSTSTRTAPANRGIYTLSAGTFADPTELHAAEREIKRLGYRPEIVTSFHKTPMTRLLVGYYSAAEAESLCRSYQKDYPGFFTLKRGEQVALYAGSYRDADRARAYAATLRDHGIKVAEETAVVAIPTKELRFGSFDDHDVAAAKAERARASGITAQVVSRQGE